MRAENIIGGAAEIKYDFARKYQGTRQSMRRNDACCDIGALHFDDRASSSEIVA